MANNPQTARASLDCLFDDPFLLHDKLSQSVKPGSTLLLGLSGGVDSVVLLHQLVQLRQTLPFELHAMHVHHGLSINANQWAAHCQWLCQQYKIHLTIVRAKVTNTGTGLEAAARQARYEALSAYQFQSQVPDWVVTAHHQGDQAETLLLQLFRGAGVKGLSAMPDASDNRLLRPMLTVSKSAILDYAKKHQLSWCQDESNQDEQFDRNFIRQQVTPVLKSRYPNLDETLGRTANQMAEAQALLVALAEQDAQHLIDARRLNVAGLAHLSDLRFQNVLRYWFECLQLNMPSRKRLVEISKQLRSAKDDAGVRLLHQGHVLLRYDGYAYLYAESILPEYVAYHLRWEGQDRITLPNGCMLHFQQVNGSGIALKHLSSPLLIQSRQGGERLKLQQNRPAKPLKQWFQAAKVPPWERDVTPLLYLADQLVCVPGLGVATGYTATNDLPGLEISLDFYKN